MWSLSRQNVGGIVELSLDRVLEIIRYNQRKPEKLEQFYENSNGKIEVDYENVVGQDRIDRFDKRKRIQRRNKRVVALGLKTTSTNKVWRNYFLILTLAILLFL